MNAGRSEEPAGSGFHRLLARLDPNPARAAEEFDRLRRALTRFFDWRGANWPEDCADETLTRLAAKIGDGVEVADVANFAHGIARMVLKEASRAQARLTPLEDVEPAAVLPGPGDDDALARQLESCLGRFRRDERDLVLAYYAGGDGRGKIENRRGLAVRFGLTDNALRSRVQRLRDRLEECVRRGLPEAGRWDRPR